MNDVAEAEPSQEAMLIMSRARIGWCMDNVRDMARLLDDVITVPIDALAAAMEGYHYESCRQILQDFVPQFFSSSTVP